MLNIFKKKEIKSYFNNSWFMNVGFSDYERTNNATKFIEFYIDSCPVFTATKLIANAVASIDIVLKDKNGKFIYEHEALTLLRNPNPFINRRLFFTELVSYYLLTGNAYINIIGQNKPLEINNYRPYDITITAGNDGYPNEYTYNSTPISSCYKRTQDKRFIDTKQNELIHLRGFNPKYSSTNLVGSSAFLGCQLEISQYILASIHNNSLLKNGARPSGILTYKGNGTLEQSQIDSIKDILKNKMSGARNAGEPAFLGGDFDWKQLSESVKDMDFANSKKTNQEAIYNAVEIPLPMINSDTMSFSNMDASTYMFYDKAVINNLKIILEFLTSKILSRYPNAKGLEYSFDESAIEALEARKYDTASKASKLGVLSDNEIRTMIGYEAVAGGDAIYKPANMLQIGQDTFTQDNRAEPMGKSEFIRIMKEQQKQDGSRFYNDEYIQLKAQEYYGN